MVLLDFGKNSNAAVICIVGTGVVLGRFAGLVWYLGRFWVI